MASEHPLQLNRRLLITRELVETEVSYVGQLQATVELYIAPLRAQLVPSTSAATHTGKPILTSDEIKCLFRNIETLSVMHAKFATELKAKLNLFTTADEKQHVISDVFLKYVPFFLLYTEFANHHDDANDMLKQLLADSAYTRFQNFERTCRSAPQSKGLGLSSLLITPIQRVPRYKLLLEELLRHTDTSHADYHGLSKSLTAVAKLALHINEEVRASENRRVMLALQDELSGSETLLAPHRAFIRKGVLTKVLTDKHETFQFYLFNDLLLYASKSGWKWKVKQTLTLDAKFSVESMPDRPAYKAFPFKVVTKERTFIVYTSDLFEKNSWLMDLQKLVAELKSKHGALPIAAGAGAQAGVGGAVGTAIRGSIGSSAERQPLSSGQSIASAAELATVWQPNEMATRCTRCLRKFGLLRRKHHCRKCGKVVCSDCSPHRLQLQQQSSDRELVRVCNTCNDTITAQQAEVEAKRSKTSVTEQEKDVAVAALLVDAPLERPQSIVSGERTGGAGPGVPPRPDGTILNDRWYWIPHAQLAFVLARFIRTEPVLIDGKSVPGPNGTVPTVNVFRSLEGEILQVPGDLSQYSTASLDTITGDIDNLVHLSAQEFSPAAILHQLSTRYKKDLIYTNIGTILISINPFKPLPLYTADRMNSYARAEEHNLSQLSPHVFGVAAKAYRSLISSGGAARDQAIVISGESGSGKTEATKLILSFLSDVARQSIGGAAAAAAGAAGAASPASPSAASFSVDQEILQSNPLLESFGNAKTVRNDNSSRFGKWMGVIFSEQRTISGGRIITYLLEKTRVVSQSDSERNFHIFYQLCGAAHSGKKQKIVNSATANAAAGERDFDTELEFVNSLGLGHARGFHYLNQSGCYTIDGVSDESSLGTTLLALRRTGFTSDQMCTLLRVLAAILHLGNIEITANMRELDVRTAAALLEVEPKALLHHLQFRLVEMIKGVEASAIPLSHTDSVATRDALAKALYARLFDWLVSRINHSLASKQAADAAAAGAARQRGDSAVDSKSAPSGAGGKANNIGVLDIFGFESFDINSLEQFFINYTNEKLHSHFNLCIFQIERDDYQSEGIELEAVAFADNSLCLELIESSVGSALRKGANGPQGILQLLDEEVALPKGNDAHLMERLVQSFDAASMQVKRPATGPAATSAAAPASSSSASDAPPVLVAPPPGQNPYFVRVIKRPNCFVVKHFCGATEYLTDGFTVKNRDKLADSLSRFLHTSKTQLIADLFNADVDICALPTTGGDASSAGDINDPTSLAYLLKEEKRRNAAKTSANSTIAFQFRQQLDTLMATLRHSQSHFVKCIKPNSRKAAFDFDGALVLSQMKSGGLVEALRINQRSKWPCRLLYKLFYNRYSVLASESGEKIIEITPAALDKPDEARKACERLMLLFPKMSALKHFFTARSNISPAVVDPDREKTPSEKVAVPIVPPPADPLAPVLKLVRLGKTKCFYGAALRNALESMLSAIGKRARAVERKSMRVPDLPPKPILDVKAAAAAAAAGGSGPSANPAVNKPKPKPPPLPTLPKHIEARPNARSVATERAPALVFVLPPLPANARAMLSPRMPGAGATGAVAATKQPAAVHPPTAVEPPAPAGPPKIPPKPSTAAIAAAMAADDSKGVDPHLTVVTAAPERSGAPPQLVIDEDEWASFNDDFFVFKATHATVDVLPAFALSTFKRLRTSVDWLSGVIFYRDALKLSHLVFQKRLIPRSLTLFDADSVECASVVLKQSFYPLWKPSSKAVPVNASPAQIAAAEAKRTTMFEPATARMMAKTLQTHAVTCFENILCYTGELYHAFPITCGNAVLSLLRKEPLLADEIYCQLIKQTTANPSEAGALLAWKLMYLCLHISPPLESREIVLAHIMKHTYELPPLPAAAAAAANAVAAKSAGGSSPRTHHIDTKSAAKSASKPAKPYAGASLFIIDLSSIDSVATLCYLQYKWLIAAMLRRTAAAQARAGAGALSPIASSGAASPRPSNQTAAAAVPASASDEPAATPLYTPPHLWRNPTAMGAAEAALFDVAYVTLITQTVGVLSTDEPEDETEADGDENAFEAENAKRAQLAKEEAERKAKSLERLKQKSAGISTGAVTASKPAQGPPAKVALWEPNKPASAPAAIVTPPAVATAAPAKTPAPAVSATTTAAVPALKLPASTAATAPAAAAATAPTAASTAAAAAANKPKFCTACGKQRPNPPTDKFCIGCGNKQPVITA